MGKLIKLTPLVIKIRELKGQGKKIGLITGCFDVLHAGHVELLRFAKKHTDILVVGLENDETIRLSKGPDRPIHDFAQRSLVMSELISVDYIFEIPITVKFAQSEEIRKQYVEMTMKISPDYLFTTKTADNYQKQKETGALEIGAKLLYFAGNHNTSTSKIAQKIKAEL
jgi:cytidyltransferase-like protein